MAFKSSEKKALYVLVVIVKFEKFIEGICKNKGITALFLQGEVKEEEAFQLN